MAFEPDGKKIDPIIWKPSSELTGLAIRRCDWVNCDQINELEGAEWLKAIIVGCYYQGLSDIVKNNSLKLKAKDAEIARLRAELDDRMAYIKGISDTLPGTGLLAVKVAALKQRLEAAEAEAKRLGEAIRWALGESDEFAARAEGQGAYWWRTELRTRAALDVAKGKV
jgi:hypothetical protein